jgi:hypothetical protein
VFKHVRVSSLHVSPFANPSAHTRPGHSGAILRQLLSTPSESVVATVFVSQK